MSDFIQGENRYQSTLFPERLDDHIAEDSAVRVIDVFIDELDLSCRVSIQAEFPGERIRAVRASLKISRSATALTPIAFVHQPGNNLSISDEL